MRRLGRAPGLGPAGDHAKTKSRRAAWRKDPDQQRAVAALVVQDGLSRAEAVEHVRGRRQGAEEGQGATKAAKSRTIRTAVGKVTVDLRKAGDAAVMFEALREAVRQLEGEVEGVEAAAA